MRLLLLLAICAFGAERSSAPRARAPMPAPVASVAPSLAPSLLPPLTAVPSVAPVARAGEAAAAAQAAEAAVLPAARALEADLSAGLSASSAQGGDVSAASARLAQAYSGESAKRRDDAAAPQGGLFSRLPFLSRRAAAAPPGRSAEPPVPAGPSEAPKRLVWLAFLWNFLTIGSYYIIGPVRGSLLMTTKWGPGSLPWVYMASAVATGAAVWLYNRFSSKSRRLVIGGTLAALAATLLGWWALLSKVSLSTLHAGPVPFAFYLWSDIFGIMGMTLFWSYINDRFHSEAGRKRFGFIAAGAPLGAILGSWLTKTYVVAMGPGPILLLSAGIFALTMLVFALMERVPRALSEASSKKAPAAKGVLSTIRGSKFLLFLTGLVLLERMVPDFSNYLFSSVTRAAFPDTRALAATLANYAMWQNVASFVGSFLFASVVLRTVGVTGALMSAAFANLIGLALFPFFPGLPLVMAYNGLEGMLRYTWFKSAKEATYTVADRDVIYRVKAFIEMFVYRFARGLAGLALLFLIPLGNSAVAWAGVPMALLWLWTAWGLAREFKAKKDANPNA